MALTKEETEERERLQELARRPSRWFRLEESERLKELNEKMSGFSKAKYSNEYLNQVMKSHYNGSL